MFWYCLGPVQMRRVRLYTTGFAALAFGRAVDCFRVFPPGSRNATLLPKSTEALVPTALA